MVPHGHPLEDEDFEVSTILLNDFLILCIVARFVPGVKHARSDVAKVGGSNPEIISLQREPHRTADDMSVDNQQERQEGDFGHRFALYGHVCVRYHRVEFANAEDFQ